MKTKPIEFDIASMVSEAKTLNKPFRTPKGPKKFSVYVKNEKGNIVKVNFGDPNMEIKRDDPERRKNFRARHNCANPGPKTKARYWSCKMWSKKSVTDMTKGSHPGYDWDGHTIFDLNDLLKDNPSLAYAEDCDDCGCDCECDCSCDCDCEAGLWKNIQKKRERIKKGSGEKMRKKGDKGAPTPEQMKKAKSKYGEKQEVVVKKSLSPKK